MFILHGVSYQIKVMDQLVPSTAPVVTSSVVLPLLGADFGEPGARMSAQSAVTVCTELLLFKVTLRVISLVILNDKVKSKFKYQSSQHAMYCSLLFNATHDVHLNFFIILTDMNVRMQNKFINSMLLTRKFD